MSEADYLVGVEEYELAFVEDVLDDAPVDAQTVYKETIDMSERAIAAEAAFRTTSGGGGGGAPSGPAGGVLGGTYPNPSFAADMATQAELDALSAQAVILAPASSARNVIQPTAGDVIAAVVKAHAAQSVDLTQWQTSAGAVLAKIELGGSLTFSPSVLGATGAVLIAAGTLPVTDPNDPRRAVLNLKATTGLATDGEPYGVRFGSYRDTNFDHTTLGKYDWMLDSYEPAGRSLPYLTLTDRRASDRKTTGSSTFGSNVLQIRTQDPGTEDTIKYWAVSPFGFSMYDIDNFVIYDTLAGSVAELAFQRAVGVWTFGVFGSAPSPVAQQSASSVGALWTALKAYGWLDAGSTAPTTFAPSAHAASHQNGGGDEMSIAGLDGTSTELAAHLADAADAHDASAISFSPTGTVAATDVQSAIAEVASEASGAPTDAQYIVGAANGSLSAEIVATAFALTLIDDANAAAARATLAAAPFTPTNLPTGALAATFDRRGAYAGTSAVIVSQRVTLVAIDLQAGMTVTSISWLSGTIGLGTGVHQYFGLYDASRARLAVTADDTSAAWNSLSIKTLNLTSPYAVTTSGLYYLAILVEATTVPTLMAADAARAEVKALAPIIAGSSSTGQSSLPDPAGAITAIAQTPFAYVS